MCRSTKSVRLMLIIAASLIVFIARHPALVEGLEEKEEIVDDFGNSTANFWQVPYNDDNSSTLWYLSTHGHPPPFDLESVRPPMEEDGGGFIEVVPYSDSPAQIYSDVFDLLAGATVELTYWNIVPFPVLARNTVLILYTEFLDLVEGTGDAPPTSVQVFTAPLPTDPSPDWTTVTVDLQINQPSKVQLRLDGNRANLTGTGLAISRIAIKNGEKRNTTTTSTTTMTSTLSDITSSTAETQTKTSSTTDMTDKRTSFPSPTKLDVEKPTTQIPPTTLTTPLPTTTTFSTTAATPLATMTINSTPVTDAPFTSPISSTLTSALSISSATTFANPETASSSSTTSPEFISPSSTVSTTINPSSNWSITSTVADTTTSQSSIAGSASASSTASTPSPSNVISTVFTTPNLPPSSSPITMPSSTDSISPMSTSTITPSSTTPQPGMASQLRAIAIGVSLSIILLVLSCLLFGFLYRRHRRRIYLIEKSQLEAGTIRPLEQLDHIPSVAQAADSDCCSTTSTTASNAPLA